MEGQESVERKWREEFDEMGEAGVREEFFYGAFQANQRMEGFACRWLEEKRKKNKKRKANRNNWIILVLAFTIIGAFILSKLGIDIFWKA
jgi:hypothetical protein